MVIAGKVILKKGKEFSIQRKHPWIFSGAIQNSDGTVTDGQWVEAVDHKGTTLGFGHYQNGSIAVRIVSFGAEAPTQNFWVIRFMQAQRLRINSALPSQHT